MIAALLCGLAFGALAVWERWLQAERERRRLDMLETLPSDPWYPSSDNYQRPYVDGEGSVSVPVRGETAIAWAPDMVDIP